MSTAARTMRLGAFLQPTGHHVAGWRLPGAYAQMGQNFEQYAQLCQTAERGLFDLLFVGDTSALWSDDEATLSVMPRSHLFEPLTLLAGLAARSSQIGLVASASTSYNEPLALARKLVSLDHISAGRAGWNIVTTVNQREAVNFNRDQHFSHADRYARAEEFVDVVRGLFDSWDADAMSYDQQNGVFFRPGSMHVLNHVGEHFSVRGPLNIAPAPQGHPLLVQAGSSGAGKGLAARVADIVFTAQNDYDDARAFYADIKAQGQAGGRMPEHLLVLPGVMPIVGRSEAEAQDKLAALQALVSPLAALQVLKDATGGVDLSGYALDQPLPPITGDNYQSRLQLVTELGRRENLTLMALARKLSISRGHRLALGTAAQVADQLEDWFVRGAADGYNVLPASMPSGLDDFVDLVVPELQRRGLYKTAYAPGDLRAKLGLPRPAAHGGAV